MGAQAEEKFFCNSIFASPQLVQYKLRSTNPNKKPIFQFLEKNYRIAEDNDVLTHLTSVQENTIDKNPFRVALWNTHKWQDDNISADFKALANSADLFLTQEAVVNKQSQAALNSSIEKEWWLANSFFSSDETSSDIANGVATGSSVQPLEVGFIRSDAREPLTRSPKMALISKFRVLGISEHLLVINVHMINFVLDSAFESMLDQIEEVLSAHLGPILLGGDFNTWSQSRMDSLNKLAHKYSLNHAIPNNDSRTIKFDHLFTRGFKVSKAQVLSRIQSSDHYPLYFEIELID